VTDADCPGTARCQNATSSAGGEHYTPPFYCAGWGRPSDVAVHPGTGALLVSDEQAGAVYIVSYAGQPWFRTMYFMVGLPLGAGVLAVALVAFAVGRWLRRRRLYTELQGSQAGASSSAPGVQAAH
jgi:hypothetical protein